MDPVRRVGDFLRDNVGHLTRPGNASYDPVSQHWLVPICARAERGDVVVGDVEVDREGHIVYAPAKDDLVARLQARLAQAPDPTSTDPAVPA